jgi:hypothetical protein
MSLLKNAGNIHNIKIANILFENVGTFKYLGTKVTNQNHFNEETKSRLKSGKAC